MKRCIIVARKFNRTRSAVFLRAAFLQYGLIHFPLRSCAGVKDKRRDAFTCLAIPGNTIRVGRQVGYCWQILTKATAEQRQIRSSRSERIRFVLQFACDKRNHPIE
jgi:hypothetical protein